MHNLLRSFKD